MYVLIVDQNTEKPKRYIIVCVWVLYRKFKISYLVICLRNTKQIYVLIVDQNSQKPKVYT